MMSKCVQFDVKEISKFVRINPKLVASKDLKVRLSKEIQKDHCVNENAVKEPSEKAKAYIKRKII